METGQDLGGAVVIQADAADQELLVYLTHHWAGASCLVLRHGRGHLEPRTTKALNLRGDARRKNVTSVTFGPGSAQQTETQQVPGTKVNKAV